MGFWNLFKKNKKEISKKDWTEEFPPEMVKSFLAEINGNPQACRNNEIPFGIGEFGLEKTNPIPTFGIPESYLYLNSLRTFDGDILRYRRTGSIEVENINKSVDEYEIFNRNGETVAFLYISPYHWKTSDNSPLGFYFKNDVQPIITIDAPPLTTFNQYSVYADYRAKQEAEQSKKYQEQKGRVKNFKSDWVQFREFLIANNIYNLYHFTDSRNLESIKEHGGLYSWYYCLTNNIDIQAPGGNELSRELDYNKGLQDFVRVSFTRNHPMMFVHPIRQRNNVILEIDTEVIYWLGSKFADKNATRTDVVIASDFETFKKLDFEIIKKPNQFGLTTEEKPYYQSEILVPTKIPIRYIKNIDQLIAANDIH